jgi:hypothetical protein
MKENPWGDTTGTAKVQGRVLWAEGGRSMEPIARRQVTLKGLKGSPRQGIYYSVRTNEQGDFEFDRILAGEYRLSDGEQWRLKVRVQDGESLTVDLTPENSTKVRDDFPQEG